MNKLQAITWLTTAETSRMSEWVQAGLWDTVCSIIHNDKDNYTIDELKQLVTIAENN